MVSLLTPSNIKVGGKKAKKRHQDIVPGDNPGDGFSINRVKSKKKGCPKSCLAIVYNQHNKSKQKVTSQEMQNEVCGPEARGLHAPQLIVHPIEKIYQWSVITGMVASSISSTGNTVFLGEIGSKRRGVFNEGVILY